MRKNNSKRDQLVKDLTTVKQGKALDHCETRGKLLLSKIVQENASQKNDKY